MADFAFFGSRADRVPILKALLKIPELFIIPATTYATPSAKRYVKYESELLSIKPDFHKVYIGGLFTQHGPFFDRYNKGKYKGQYFINPVTGCFLQLSFPNICSNRSWLGFQHMTQGSLFMNKLFYDPERHIVERQSNAMKVVYQACKRAVKSTLTRMPECQNILVGEHGRALLENDKAIVLVKGTWFTGKGECLKSNAPRPKGTDEFMRELSEAAKLTVESRGERRQQLRVRMESRKIPSSREKPSM